MEQRFPDSIYGDLLIEISMIKIANNGASPPCAWLMSAIVIAHYATPKPRGYSKRLEKSTKLLYTSKHVSASHNDTWDIKLSMSGSAIVITLISQE